MVDHHFMQNELICQRLKERIWHNPLMLMCDTYNKVLVAEGTPRIQTANLTYHLFQAWCDLVLAVMIHHNQNHQMGLHLLGASSTLIERTAELVGMFHKNMSQKIF